MVRFGTETILYGRAPGGGVRLRHPRWAEFDDWAALRRENADWLAPWEPDWDPAHLSRNAYRARMAAFKKMVAGDTGYPFHIFRAADDVFIGACNLSDIRRHAAQTARIGYWVGEAFAGQGFARAAVLAAVRFAFDDLGLHRVEAAVQPENQRSVNLLKAVGFQSEGTARGYLRINGRWQDHEIYARLSGD